MGATNRRPLARMIVDTLIDEHHDGHGVRKMVATPAVGGVYIHLEHSDGRQFSKLVPCQSCGRRAA